MDFPKLRSPYPILNPIAVFNRFPRLRDKLFTPFPAPVNLCKAETIPDDAFFKAFIVDVPARDSFSNAFVTVFVDVPTFPPAAANCANACVIRIVFSLTLGAFCIALKNSSVSFDNALSPDAVCEVFPPALANLPIDCTNRFTSSLIVPTLCSFCAASLVCSPSFNTLFADCPVFSPAFASLDSEDTKRFTPLDTSGMFPSFDMESVIRTKSFGLNLLVSTLNSLFRAFTVLLIPESLKFAFPRLLKEFTTFSIPSAVFFAPSAFMLFRDFSIFVIPDISGAENLIFERDFIDAESVPISFENFRIPEISFVNAVLIDRNVEAKLLSDFTAWSASADNCIFRLSTVPSAIVPPPNFVRLATIS